MFGSAIIDIAIGMVFVFLLVSLLASTINEMALSLLNMRGKELLRGIKTLLSDTNATGLVSRLYNHGQIFGLFAGNFDPNNPRNLPSYIPATNFVMAFLDVVPQHAGLPDSIQPASPAIVLQPASPPDASNLIAVIGAVQQDARAVLLKLRTAAQALANDIATEKVGTPLISMIDAAGGDVTKLKASLEDWYNSAMDRVSGWYKYRTQWILFWIGLVLAVALNADAVGIAKQLSKDSTLRESIVAAAQSAKRPDGEGGQPIETQIEQARKKVSEIENLGIPLGWTKAPDFRDWQIYVGWLFTAVAVSLGAPFWFDMLNKIMVVRSTVKPREKSQEEAPKEPLATKQTQST
jgi:hypothetical protein